MKRKYWAINRNWFIFRLKGMLSFFSNWSISFLRDYCSVDLTTINKAEEAIYNLLRELESSTWKEP